MRMEGIGREFLEKTEYRHLAPSDQERGVAQPPLQVRLGDGEVVALPDPEAARDSGLRLREAFETRRSLREYGDDPLSLAELSYLLWSTQGVSRVIPGRATFRTVPSAGARHAFETVVLANRVESLEPGAYQYLALDHRLVRLDPSPDLAGRMAEACLGQEMVRRSAAAFVWVADRGRMSWRYGERGVRYLFLDAGHVCQNLYLAAESIGAGACAIGAFDDQRINELLGLDGTERFVVYLASVGKRTAG
jgi:SagB-type dehydrogenase family enzyme